MNIIFIGDIVGKPGRNCVKGLLPELKHEYSADFVIANGENAAGGFGITEMTGLELFHAGVDLITSGNHIWDKKEAVQYVAKEDRLIRPANYPPGVPGSGSYVYSFPDGRSLAVINLSGRVFMANLDCPFRAAERELESIGGSTRNILIDFHAEATSEKIALGRFLDGKVSAVIGTHTHVQTADEIILPGGSAYITDAGMTGPTESVIGVKVEQVLERFLNAMPARFDAAIGPSLLCGVFVEIDDYSGRAMRIERIQRRCT